jgi:hypothetical protein
MAESIDHYARTVEQLISEHRIYEQLKKRMREPVRDVRKAVRARALATLPAGGGLNAWVAAGRLKAQIEAAGARVVVHLSDGRNSARNRSDFNRIDAGKVRHPAWGRRGLGQWSVTRVEPGFFTVPATTPDPWVAAADRALDEGLEVIR